MQQLRLEFDDRDWRRAPTGEPIPPADYFLAAPRTYHRAEVARARRRHAQPQPICATLQEFRALVAAAAAALDGPK
jgi:hypothetical protein